MTKVLSKYLTYIKMDILYANLYYFQYFLQLVYVKNVELTELAPKCVKVKFIVEHKVQSLHQFGETFIRNNYFPDLCSAFLGLWMDLSTSRVYRDIVVSIIMYDFTIL